MSVSLLRSAAAVYRECRCQKRWASSGGFHLRRAVTGIVAMWWDVRYLSSGCARFRGFLDVSLVADEDEVAPRFAVFLGAAVIRLVVLCRFERVDRGGASSSSSSSRRRLNLAGGSSRGRCAADASLSWSESSSSDSGWAVRSTMGAVWGRGRGAGCVFVRSGGNHVGAAYDMHGAWRF
jgi:hypothetical protein